ncbi:mitochondrial carrier [Lipomyces japonicus]|uniref:mitochondrial carrier n=1 Tax=Lipomyces japonicus TaxID=56871 RepID=UPI0034CFEB18
MDHSVAIPLLSGAAAGTCTDLVFFPVDTVKTRLQAKGGFSANGGWAGVYRGVGSAIVGSAPGASLFFLTYEFLNTNLYPHLASRLDHDDALARPLTHMLAASAGEVAACSVRVPTEVVKQRAQAAIHPSSAAALKAVLQAEGVRGLYRGYATTILREIPFTAIQFPLYEALKRARARARTRDGNQVLAQPSPLDGALCGSVAGGVAAALTTPLDVLKTRIMLARDPVPVAVLARQIAADEGLAAFFRGVGPRTLWISAGGAVFLGGYESTKALLTSFTSSASPSLSP